MFDLLFGDLRRVPGRGRPVEGRSLVDHDMTNAPWQATLPEEVHE